MLLKKLSMLAAGFAAAALIWNVPKAYAFDEEELLEKCSNRDCYNYIGTTENGEGKQKFYDDVYEACREFWLDDENDISHNYGRFSNIQDTYGLEEDDCEMVLRAITNDNPLFFFLHSDYSFSRVTQKNITKTTIILVPNSEYKIGKNRAKIKEDIYEYIKNSESQIDRNDSTYNKICAVNEKMVKENEYWYDDKVNMIPTEDSAAYNIVGPVQKGKAVCMGYSLTFDMLMKYYGVECYLVYNNYHAWNVVRLDDGKLYYVDSTWNDDGDHSNDTYLLKGSVTDDQLHGEYYDYRRDYFPVSEVNTDDFVTTKKPDDSSSKSDETKYQRGDVNKDGKIDIEDAVTMIGYINGNNRISDTSLADLVQDGKVDIEDVVVIINYVNGISTF